MDRTQLGFTIAALYNIHIIVFSRGFSDVLGAVDPTFGSGGSVGILLWGLAYCTPQSLRAGSSCRTRLRHREALFRFTLGTLDERPCRRAPVDVQ